MKSAKITRLTKDDISAELGTVDPRPNQKQKIDSAENRGSLYSTEYIKKLHIDEIANFFEPFGFVAAAKIPSEQEPKFVFATCEDFQVVFSDYNFVFDFDGGVKTRSAKKINMEAFKNYCASIEKTPEQVVSEMMTVQLFGYRFPSYSKNRLSVKQKESELAFDNLPSEMRKLLKLTKEQKESELVATFNKNHYGNYEIDPLMYGDIDK